jgi:dTDP-4-dehydrorhamnose 3,5-epimerase
MTFKLFKIKKFSDKRGYSRVFEFSKSIKNKFNRIYFTNNKKIGTIRGLHFQKKNKQNKLLIVQEGVIFDVLVNINKKSKNFKKIYTFELGDKKKFNCIYVPSNFAHGLQTLKKNTKLIYLIDQNFEKKNELIRYDNGNLNIKWPIKKIILSKKDNQKSSFLV